MSTSPINNTVKAVVEGFAAAEAETRKESYKELIATILAFIITIVLISFIGKWLWNTAVVELVSFAKPAKSVWHILGLYLIYALLRS